MYGSNWAYAGWGYPMRGYLGAGIGYPYYGGIQAWGCGYPGWGCGYPVCGGYGLPYYR